MSKPASDRTQLANLKRLYKAQIKELSEAQRLLRDYWARATKAEQECAAWRGRFDALLFQRAAATVSASDPPPSPTPPRTD